MHTKRKQAFTLVEIMVVISVIAILAMASFKLMRAAAHNKKVAETQAKMECLKNALSGYYAHYGHYPPVPFYSSLNPDDARDGDRNNLPDSFEGRAVAASRAQPMAYGYPPPEHVKQPRIDLLFNDPKSKDRKVVDMFAGYVRSFDPKEPKWDGGPKAFKFGLLSFLLPRLEVMAFSENELTIRDTRVFNLAQWQEHNPATPRGLPDTAAYQQEFVRRLQAQRQMENDICARWLPHLEKVISGEGDPILGINIWTRITGSHSDGGGLQRLTPTLVGGSADAGYDVAGMSATCVDAWNNSFFYHSMPPYQSYILWSAGPDGKTFPPWIDSKDYGKFKDCTPKKVLEMTKDDIIERSM